MPESGQTNLTDWSTVGDVCRKFTCHLVLSEGDIFGAGSTVSEVYRSAVDAAETLWSVRLACCPDAGNLSENLRFFELVASNRGMNIRLFTAIADALDWLGVAEQS
jgi:hypothetical protein